MAGILTLWAEKQNPQLIEGAVVLEVKPLENSLNNYTFTVSIHSQDKGCDYYADWWEILSEEGKLLTRKVFSKSYVDEQPFSTSNSSKPVKISPEQVVIVRAHMHTNNSNNTGYEAMQALKGTVNKGFNFIRLSKNLAASVAKEEPQPPKCHST